MLRERSCFRVAIYAVTVIWLLRLDGSFILVAFSRLTLNGHKPAVFTLGVPVAWTEGKEGRAALVAAIPPALSQLVWDFLGL